MKVKVKALANISGGSHGPRSIGDEFDVDAVLRDELIARGLVEDVVTLLVDETPSKSSSKVAVAKE